MVDPIRGPAWNGPRPGRSLSCMAAMQPPPRRVLIVAYYFPPIGGIGSIRLARFAELLPEFGWEPTVLAPRDTPHARDPHLRFPEDKVIRSRSIELSRAGRVLPGAGSGGGGAK